MISVHDICGYLRGCVPFLRIAIPGPTGVCLNTATRMSAVFSKSVPPSPRGPSLPYLPSPR